MVGVAFWESLFQHTGQHGSNIEYTTNDKLFADMRNWVFFQDYNCPCSKMHQDVAVHHSCTIPAIATCSCPRHVTGERTLSSMICIKSTTCHRRLELYLTFTLTPASNKRLTEDSLRWHHGDFHEIRLYIYLQFTNKKLDYNNLTN